MFNINKETFRENKFFIVSLSLLTLIFLLGLSAQAAEIEPPEVDYQSFKLDNGLEVLVFPDHSVPSLKFSMYYKVGAVDEPEGQTGISHFLEHIMFLGTKNLPEGKIDDLVSSVGGQLNAATSYDYTYYYYELPSSMLELAMALEADRMSNLKFNSAEINREREVIKQERRMRTENNIFARGFEEIRAKAFKDSYLEHSVIGWMEDINSIKTEELKNYYQQYYSPNNALLVVSGDVKLAAVKKLAKKYYSSYQPQEIKRRNFELPEQMKEQTYKVHLNTNIPYALQLYKIPSADNFEVAALEIFFDILANNQSSRLKQKLKKEKGIILDAGAYVYPMRTESFALSYFIPASPDLVEKSQAAYDRELKRIFTEGITQEEFQIVKKQYQKSLIFSQKDINSTASTYALNKLRFNDADLLKDKIKYINQLSREEVVNIAQKYLSNEKRTKGYILPKAEGGAE